MPAFDVVVVGSGGGLDETNLSGYLVKTCDASWDDGIMALEAGSGHGALGHIMKQNPDIFRERSEDEDRVKKEVTPYSIYSNVKCFLLTHAHLDHISSLVMSAGTIGGDSKRIYGSPQTLRDLETIFSDRVWPRLATYDESDPSFQLVYHPIHADGKYETIFPDIAVRTMTISHGKNSSGPYESSCFFVKHVPTEHEFVFFGDVEPDSVAVEPRNAAVWRAAAPKIPHDLSVVFIECSYPAGQPDDALWGHLSPDHLVREMITLATEVVLARRSRSQERQQHPSSSPSSSSSSSPSSSYSSSSSSRPRKKQKRSSRLPLAPEALHDALEGLSVYVMHCKEDFSTQRAINHIIGDQCREMLAPHKLGLKLLTADQGMKIVI